MRQTIRNVASAALLAALVLTPIAADAGESVRVLILKEHGVGSSTSAQGYVDKLVAQVAKQNSWAAAEGKYLTSRRLAKAYISESDPQFGILSLSSFLDLRESHGLDVVGSAEVTGGGGRQYFIVSASQTTLAGCKGKVLGTDHGDDPRFINKVVGNDDFALKDFTVEDTRRPMKTIKAVVRGEVTCALIDDAQQAGMARVDGGAALEVVWSSDKLPPMVVVAFPSAPSAERKRFQANLGKVCSGAGASACKEVGLSSLRKASDSDYASVIKDYGG